MVVLSTASAYKFPAAVLSSLEETDEPDEFMLLQRLSQLTGTPIPANLRDLDKKPERHTNVIPKSQMQDFVTAL